MSESKSPFAGWVVVTLTAVIAAAAVVQVWSSILNQRAFVFPTSTNFTGPLVANVQPLSLYLNVRNSGRSVATIENLIAIVTHNLPPRPLYSEQPGRLKTAFPPIPAGGTIQKPLNFGEPWGEDTTRKVKDGTMGFYMYGKIEYRDDYSGLPFIGQRRSDFCFVYVPSAEPDKAVFRNCPEPAYTNTR